MRNRFSVATKKKARRLPAAGIEVALRIKTMNKRVAVHRGANANQRAAS
jgi:hypothetical protein